MHLPAEPMPIQEAFAWTAQRAVLKPQPTHVDPADKFIIRSSYQKAVRRGQVERAVDMALALHRIDSRYVWRAILTVALEDVGLGSPDAVWFATHAQSSVFRRAVGELPLLIALTREMASSLKSRAACELSFVVDTGEPEIFRHFATMTTEHLLRRFAADDLYEAYAAISVLRGVVPTGYRARQPDPAGILAAIEIMDDQASGRTAQAAKSALRRPLDNMAMGYVVLSRLTVDPDHLELLQDQPPESVLIRGYPSEAYDQHERTGRRAIRAFGSRLLQSQPELSGLLRQSFFAALADAVFVVEGQALDRWIADAPMARLRHEADVFTLSRHGLRPDQAAVLTGAVRDCVDDLNACRLSAALENTAG